jgi:alpha-glucosidase
VGEVGDAQRGLDIMGEYTRGDDLVQMCYAFELLSGDQPDAAFVADVMNKVADVAPDGWACWAYSNHDVARHATRWGLSDQAQRLFITLLMCLRGSACIYQGEELGLAEAEIAFADLQDPYGIEFWPEFKGRDGCRTPMVWDSAAPQGGFSTNADTWLPVASEHLPMAVDQAEAQSDALIHHYRDVIALRRAHPALAKGEMLDLNADGTLLQFERRRGDERILCQFNMGNTPIIADRPTGDWQLLVGDDTTAIPAWGARIMKEGV